MILSGTYLLNVFILLEVLLKQITSFVGGGTGLALPSFQWYANLVTISVESCMLTTLPNLGKGLCLLAAFVACKA